VPALPSSVLEPLWVQVAALLPTRQVSHPLGCHRPRIADRVVFDKLIQVLVFGCGYRRIADATCSASTLRRRRDEWIRAGVAEQLRRAVLAAYDRLFGLELEHLVVDGCITKAPCGGQVAGPAARDEQVAAELEVQRIETGIVRAALHRLGLDGRVTVVHGDGYDGWPAAASYDRIIVTCGCVGLSPRWLAQLAPGGLALVPVAHGGAHPIVAAWHDGPTARGRMALWADFMEAAGPLAQQQATVLHTIPADAEFTSYPRVGPVLDAAGIARQRLADEDLPWARWNHLQRRLDPPAATTPS
jgi:transposase